MNKIKTWLRSSIVNRRFKTRLGLAVASTSFSLSCFLSSIIGYISQAQIKIDRGILMEQLAYQMTINLDRQMFVYFQEIKTLSKLHIIRSPEQSILNKRRLLDELKYLYNDYAWIGLTDSKGLLLATTDSILQGKKVSERPWFISGKVKPTVQDVHEAKLLKGLIPNLNPNGEPLRFVDISVPVFDLEENFSGVLVAHLYWEFSLKLREELLQPIKKYRNVEVIILSKQGDILLAPITPINQTKTQPDNSSLNLNYLQSFQAAQKNKKGWQVEKIGNKNSYLIGYAQTQGFNDYQGLGWIVLVTQPSQEAFDIAKNIQKTILLWGIIVGIVSGAMAWYVADKLINPVISISKAANQIRQGNSQVKIPIFTGVDELIILSQSVAQLHNNSEKQKQLLKKFNLELEDKVKERTLELNQVNQQLLTEINERKRVQLSLEQANKTLKKLAIVDSLTGIANRRYFDEFLKQELKRAARENLFLSLLLLDIDYFKRYNDFYGHQAGDVCLQKVAQALNNSVKRPTDLVARYGGEEFAVILSNTNINGASHIASIICENIQNLQIPHQGSDVSEYVSVSIGVATFECLNNISPISLIKAADKLLYQAKEQGRNRFKSKVINLLKI